MSNMKAVATIDRILYDPLSYLHGSRLSLSEAVMKVPQRAALNAIVASTYGLRDYPDLPRTPAERYLVDCWWELPRVCLLVGAYCGRAELLGRAEFMRLSPSVRHFMLLRLGDVGLRVTKQTLPVALPRVQRMQCIGIAAMAWWFGSVSETWRQRIPLLFHAAIPDVVFEERCAVRIASSFLIHQAIQYAKNHPDIS